MGPVSHNYDVCDSLMSSSAKIIKTWPVLASAPLMKQKLKLPLFKRNSECALPQIPKRRLSFFSLSYSRTVSFFLQKFSPHCSNSRVETGPFGRVPAWLTDQWLFRGKSAFYRQQFRNSLEFFPHCELQVRKKIIRLNTRQLKFLSADLRQVLQSLLQ